MTLQELCFVLDKFDKLIVRYEETMVDTVLDRAVYDHSLDSLMKRQVSYIGTVKRQGKTYITIELE